MNKLHNLKLSKTFCMAPFMHIHNVPNGDILPCCIGLGGSMGNLYENSIEEIWNNEKYRQLRNDMLNDVPSNHCTRCYKEEEWGNKHSLRKIFNNQYADKYYELVNDTQDGVVKNMKFVKWDFRFNNLCNLACTACHPTYSSSWVPIMKQVDSNYKEEQFVNSKINKDKFVQTIKSQIDNVEEVYFAGGEPLLHEEHFEILNFIDTENKLGNINFSYSTNLTSLKYKSINVIDYWKKMKYLRVMVSIDEVDADRLYYIRYPSELNKIVDNLRILKNNLTEHNLHYSVTPTWSLMNLHRIKNILEFFYKEDLLSHTFYNTTTWESDFHNILLFSPQYFSIRSASNQWKDYLRTMLKEYVVWYKDVLIPKKIDTIVKNSSIKVLDDRIQNFLNSLNETVDGHVGYYGDYLARLDKVRNTDFFKTFPELEWRQYENT